MIVFQIIIGLVILGFLVLIHELGHFLAAKSVKIRVLAFSIGFGKPLLKKKYGETEYRICAIPFGGYVNMAGENPSDERKNSNDEFSTKPIWQRAYVAIAGPAANIVTAVLFLWLAFLVGIQHPKYLDSPIIGAVSSKSPAAQTGIAAGDSIVQINGKDVKSFEDIQQLFSRQDKEYVITYIHENQTKTDTLPRVKEQGIGFPRFPLGGLLPKFPAVVKSVNHNTPAEKMGILPDDSIVAIDGKLIYSWFQVQDLIANFDSSRGALQVTIQREAVAKSFSVRPDYDSKEKRFMLGIAPRDPVTVSISYPPKQAWNRALKKSWEYTTMIFDVLKKLVTNVVSPRQLAGPVGIIQMSGAVAMGHISDLLNFLALIGINLGVLNLFPLIITDGGVLLFLFIEAIRRKPLPIRTQVLINNIAIALFVALFIFVTFNDILRIPQLFRMMGR